MLPQARRIIGYFHLSTQGTVEFHVFDMNWCSVRLNMLAPTLCMIWQGPWNRGASFRMMASAANDK